MNTNTQRDADTDKKERKTSWTFHKAVCDAAAVAVAIATISTELY